MNRILLIGDLAEDSFIWGECTRLSPEAPCVVFVPEKAASNPGMAGNVLANMLTLSPDIEVDTLFPEKASTKVRHVDKKSNQHLIRLDNDYISPPLEMAVFEKILETNKYDAVVMSDYNKGYLNHINMGLIADICFALSIPTFVDTKQILSDWSKNITYVKINSVELRNQYAARVSSPWEFCQNLIVTQGKDGMVIFNSDGSEKYRTVGNNATVFDVSGAGDSVLAGLVIRFIETKDIVLSMDWANKVGAKAVSRRGVTTVTREEIE